MRVPLHFLLLLPLALAVPWLSSLSLGVDYYPETWSEAQWEVDAAAMQAAGMSTVRVAEFAWHRLQPSASAAYNFTWLDRALGVLSAHGICAIVGTPTASPPQWLYRQDPSIALVNAAGERLGTGSRQNMNHLHPLIQSSTRDIVSAIARHYAGDARVCAFQIDNEIHGEPDFSPLTAAGFAQWLAQKYNASTDAMNAAWGTQFWGEEYDAFEDVPLPWDTPDGHNPGLALDYRRFLAHVGASYLELQAGILRALAPATPLTHNCMGTYTGVDYSRFARSLDAVAFDNYPLTWFGGAPTDYSRGSEGPVYAAALQLAVMRGAKGGAPFFVMEHQVANTGQFFYYGSGWREGYRLATWQSIANGADGVQYFRWRTSRWGQEQHWEGVLNWDGDVSAPRYAAVAAIGAEFKRVSPRVFGGRVRARVALLWSLETAWAFAEQSLTGAAAPFDALPQMRGLLAAFRARGQAVDVVFLPADAGGAAPAPPPLNLTGYSIVLAPTLYLVPDSVAGALGAFVASGGQLFLSMRSGAKDAHNAYVGTPLPGPFAALAGLTMSQWDPLCSLGEGALLPLGNFSQPASSAPWSLSTSQGRICELLLPKDPGVRVLASYAQGVHAGQPAMTYLGSSMGGTLYSGAVSDDAGYYGAIAELLAGEAGVALLDRLPYGVEVSTRHLSSGAAAHFVLNWGGGAVSVTLPAAAAQGCVDVLGGRPVSPLGGIELPAYEVAVISCPA